MVGDFGVFEALANADTVYMSVFVLGELFAGFRGGIFSANQWYHQTSLIFIKVISIRPCHYTLFVPSDGFFPIE